MLSWPQVLWAVLALAVLPVPVLALRQHGWSTLETHGDGTEFLLWILLVLGASATLPAALLAWRIRRRGTLEWLVLAGAQAVILIALIYADAYLDACMHAEGRNPSFLSPSSW